MSCHQSWMSAPGGYSPAHRPVLNQVRNQPVLLVVIGVLLLPAPARLLVALAVTGMISTDLLAVDGLGIGTEPYPAIPAMTETRHAMLPWIHHRVAAGQSRKRSCGPWAPRQGSVRSGGSETQDQPPRWSSFGEHTQASSGRRPSAHGPVPYGAQEQVLLETEAPEGAGLPEHASTTWR
jgi:hypothetical protein